MPSLSSECWSTWSESSGGRCVWPGASDPWNTRIPLRRAHRGGPWPQTASSKAPDHRRHALPVGVERVHPNDSARIGGVDHLVVTDVNADVVKVGLVGAEGKGDHVTRLNIGWCHRCTHSCLQLRGVRQ